MKNIGVLIIVAVIVLIVFQGRNKSQEDKEINDKVIVNKSSQKSEAQKVKSSQKFDDSSSENKKRLTAEDKSDQEKAAFEEKLKNEMSKPVERFKMKGKSIDEFVEEINKFSDVKVHYISEGTPGFLIDDRFAKPKKSSKLNLDFENMPIGEILRYFSIVSHKIYKVDMDNQRIILADHSVILEEQITEKYADLFEGTVESETAESAIAIQRKLEDLGVSFGAGSDLTIENGQLLITNSEENHEKLKQIREQLTDN